jgi:hypothetical protein
MCPLCPFAFKRRAKKWRGPLAPALPSKVHGLAAVFAITPIFCAKAMKVGVLIAAAVAP